MRPGTLSLPSGSPPSSPSQVIRGPRSVTWSLPDRSPYRDYSRDSISLPSIQVQSEHGDPGLEDPQTLDPNTPEFLAWKRLYLSKAKLAGITEMAALMAGFSVVATVELQINDDANPYLLSAFTVVTALLVCTTMLSIMISTCILPHIIVVSKMSPYSHANESPHDKMMTYIDLSWVLANSISIFLFSTDVVLLCWIKFTYFSQVAPWCATAIMIPVLIAVCAFGVIFYRKIVKHQYLISDRKYQELEEMKRQLDSNVTINNNVHII